MKLSPENPPQVGDVLVHNEWVCTYVDPNEAWFKTAGGEPRSFCPRHPDCFLHGLEVTRPAKKVTGELVGEIEISGTNCYVIGGAPVSLAIAELRNRGKRVALVILEDN